MTIHHHDHAEKVRLTVECSADERTYIKMLAASKNTTISELLLTPFKKIMPQGRRRTPNADTIKALRESREEKLESYDTLEEFWDAMGINPDA